MALVASLSSWRLCCQCFAGFGAMGFLSYPPNSGVTEVATVTNPLTSPLLHLPRHHFLLLRSLQSGGCFSALLAEVHLGGCYATSTLFGRMLCRWGLSWSYLLVVDALPPLLVWGACFVGSSSSLADALPLGISVLQWRLCNHSVLCFFHAFFSQL